MMTGQTDELLRQIKQSFRMRMNGVAAQSMRSKGVDYHLNWGVSLPDLRQMASEYGKNYDLAIALWKENIRECKVLATLIMPAEKMIREVVDIWMEQTHTQEMAEMASFNLYQHLDYAPQLAYESIASSQELVQMTGYLILARLFMRGMEPNERGINEFLDQAEVALQEGSLSLKRSVRACVLRFCELGEAYEGIAKSALKTQYLDIL